VRGHLWLLLGRHGRLGHYPKPRNPEPGSRNPKHGTRNSKPETRNQMANVDHVVNLKLIMLST